VFGGVLTNLTDSNGGALLYQLFSVILHKGAIFPSGLIR
jgi:hypothetical protein